MPRLPAVDPYLETARLLADEMPGLVAQLLHDHPGTPDERGLCPGCTIPGGVRRVPAPCSLHKLAQLAQHLAR